MKKNIITVLAVLALMLSISGCGEKKPTPPKAPSGNNLDIAIDQGIKVIKNDPTKYESTFEQLLEIASKQKSVENRTKIMRFSRYAVDNGLTSIDETMYQFKLYFADAWVTVPTEKVSSKSQCSRLNEIIRNVDIEKKKKQRGFVNVMGDKEQYLNLKAKADDFIKFSQIFCRAIDK